MRKGSAFEAERTLLLSIYPSPADSVLQSVLPIMTDTDPPATEAGNSPDCLGWCILSILTQMLLPGDLLGVLGQ